MPFLFCFQNLEASSTLHVLPGKDKIDALVAKASFFYIGLIISWEAASNLTFDQKYI